MNKTWRFLFFFTWLVLVGIIIYLALSLATTNTNIQQQIINQHISKGNGLSAYDVAKKNGFKGTEVQWIASLKGEDSISKETTIETQTTKETKVIEQVPVEGKSSYQVWLDLGNVGTPQNYIESLKGVDAKTVVQQLRLNETTNKLETKLSTETFWKVVQSCGGLTGRVCN